MEKNESPSTPNVNSIESNAPPSSPPPKVESKESKANGGPKHTKIYTMAIILGFFLAIASLYQINQLTTQQEQVDDLNDTIAEMNSIKRELISFERQYASIFYELRSFDSSLYSQNLSDPTTDDRFKFGCYTGYVGFNLRYAVIESGFRKIFYDNFNGMTALKAKYDWLFKEKTNASYIDQIWTDDGDFYYEKVYRNSSIVTFVRLYNESMLGSIEDIGADFQNIWNTNQFSYGFSEELISLIIYGPIKIRFDQNRFNAILDTKIEERDTLVAHIGLLSNNLIANGMALILVSFLVNFGEKDLILKRVYIITAILLALLSLAGPRFIFSFFSMG